jgi:hypothetical protein
MLRLLLLTLAVAASAFSPGTPLTFSPALCLSCREAPRSFGLKRSSVMGNKSSLSAYRVDRSRLNPEQLEALLEVERELTEVFRKYDKNRDGHLTMEEYNQWCYDTKRTARLFTGELRFLNFCKAIGSDPSKGLSLEGLVNLYSKSTQVDSMGRWAGKGSVEGRRWG